MRKKMRVILAVCIGVGFAGILSRGIINVIAADIHVTVTDPEMESMLGGGRYAVSESTPVPLPETTARPFVNERSRDIVMPGRNYTALQTPKPILSEYTTEFTSTPESRNVNINLAAKSLDNTIVMPGETFSYNEALGPTNREHGYQRSQIFVRGKKAYGYGGGVCQVSSTLFNAVDKAGLEVVERHNHSLPVHYVPNGMDAATSYGSIDFKFVNTLTYPIEINASVTGNSVMVQIVRA